MVWAMMPSAASPATSASSSVIWFMAINCRISPRGDPSGLRGNAATA